MPNQRAQVEYRLPGFSQRAANVCILFAETFVADHPATKTTAMLCWARGPPE